MNTQVNLVAIMVPFLIQDYLCYCTIKMVKRYMCNKAAVTNTLINGSNASSTWNELYCASQRLLARNFTVFGHSRKQFSVKKLWNPLYTTCPAPNSRQTQLTSSWWIEWSIYISRRSWWRPKTKKAIQDFSSSGGHKRDHSSPYQLKRG